MKFTTLLKTLTFGLLFSFGIATSYVMADDADETTTAGTTAGTTDETITDDTTDKDKPEENTPEENTPEENTPAE